MKDNLIEYKTALLAREKGLPVMLDYASNVTGYSLNWGNENPTSYKVHSSFPSEDKFLYAPTKSLLQAWLREQNIFVEVLLDCTSYPKFAVEVFVFSGIIADFVKVEQKDWGLYRSYSEALEIGLLLGLEQINE